MDPPPQTLFSNAIREGEGFELQSVMVDGSRLWGGIRAKGEAGKVRALNCSRVLIGQKQQLLSLGKKPVEVGLWHMLYLCS